MNKICYGTFKLPLNYLNKKKHGPVWTAINFGIELPCVYEAHTCLYPRPPRTPGHC